MIEELENVFEIFRISKRTLVAKKRKLRRSRKPRLKNTGAEHKMITEFISTNKK